MLPQVDSLQEAVAPVARFERVSVLAVDDDPRNLTVIDLALEGIAARVVKSSSGDDALRHLLVEDFALVILDVVMPAIGGFDVAELMRERERTRYTPIIFMTAARPKDEDVRRGYALGAVDYLIKPVIPEVLRAKARFFVELQKRTHEVERQAQRLAELERAEARRTLAAERRRWEAEALRKQMEEQQRLNAQLEEADRRKDEFLATLAHELRNPLTPIVSGLELLKAGCAGDSVAERAHHTMVRQTRHLKRLVDDLVDIARVSTGKIVLKKECVRAEVAIEQAIESCVHLLRRKRSEVTIESHPVPVELDADPVRLVQIVANLVSNAARYSEIEGTIVVGWHLVDAELEIRVRDDGRGIEPELLPRVFDKFVQRDTGEGLGIGLTLVRELVVLHGGTIEARSEGLGHGSEFVVRLPGAREVVEQDGEQAPVPTPAPRTSSELLNVAVVEDDPDVRDLVSQLIESWGHHVMTASTGPEGVELVLRQRPDVAFIDIGLPQLDGCAVAKRIRTELGVPASPKLVAMSGFSQPQHVQNMEDAGFDEHLVKPSSPEEIRSALQLSSGEPR